MSEPFIAEIRMFAGNFAPRGWTFCNGQLLPIAQNTALFSLIGTTYGGDGRTTTGLPNLQGRMPIGEGRGPGLSDRRLGSSGGAISHTLSEAEMAAHSHTIVASADAADTANPLGASTLGVSESPVYGPASDLEPFGTRVGGGQSHTNQQPFLTLNFILALVGTFPSRA